MPGGSREKRLYPRVRSENPVHVKALGPSALEGPAKTRVLGLGGCSFTATESVGEGTVVELMIALGDRYITAVGRVVYEIAHGPEAFEVGVKFLRISPEDRLALEGAVETREAILH